MPSSWTPSLRFELQFTGENINVWGDKLNAALSRVDQAVAGWAVVPVNGNYALSAANGAADEARSAMLKFTGAGGTVTIPSVSKQYMAWNACSGPVTLTTGAGAVVTLGAGDIRAVFSDGAAVHELGFNGSSLKNYVDGLAWAVAAGTLPSQSGNAGKYVYTDGVAAGWRQIIVADVVGAAPVAAPSFTGGITVAGGLDISGGTRGNVVPVGASSLDFAAGEFQAKTIASDTTFNTVGTIPGKWSAMILVLTTASNAQATFAGVLWDGGVAPVFTNGTHLVGLVYDGGARYGTVLGLCYS